MSSPAGWYPDPADTSVRRWWDGRRWTNRLSRLDDPGRARDIDSPGPGGGRWWSRRTREPDVTYDRA